MPTLCLSCIVFTLKDKAVEENKYINMFIIWLTSLIKSGGLQEDDMVYVYTDNLTIEYIEANTIFPSLQNLCRFQCEIIVLPSPKTILEGMMMKYTIYPYEQDVFMYCDIDVFIVKSLHSLVDKMVENRIYLSPEGLLKDDIYSADLPSNYTIDPNTVGISSGKFAIYGKDQRDSLFKLINSICKYDSTYYTADQPFFNHVILLKLPTTLSASLDYKIFDSPAVSFNTQEYDVDKTVLIDCAGATGNGQIHYDKMLSILCLFYCGNY